MFIQKILCRISGVCVEADDSVRPYQLRLILAVGALRLWNLPKHPAHAEAAQEVQLFSARFFRVE